MKLTKHIWILWGIVLAVVLVFAFILPFERNEIFWIGLGCTFAMFLVCLLILIRGFRKNRTLESKLLRWPLFKISVIALAVQTIVGFVLMSFSALCPIWAAILFELPLFAIMGICLVVNDAAREVIVQSEAAILDSTAAWKSIRVRAAALASSSDSSELRRLSESIRFADPTPTALDEEIAHLLDELSAECDTDTLAKAFALLEQRKTLAKEAKRKEQHK